LPAAPLGKGISQDGVGNAVKIALALQETRLEEFTREVGRAGAMDPGPGLTPEVGPDPCPSSRLPGRALLELFIMLKQHSLYMIIVLM